VRSDHARAAYEACAEHYDFITQHHDYDDWTASLERLARVHGLSGNRLLDIACGTGKSFMPFVRRGYRVTACDISAAMVRHAAEKAPPEVRLDVHDIRRLPRLGSFDLVTCIDDALNYLLSLDEVAQALDGVRRNLAPRGIAVFDVNSVRSFRAFFGSLSVVPSDDRVAVWDGGAPAAFGPGEVACARLDVLQRSEDGTWQRDEGTHHQRHHPREDVERAIELAGLELAAVYGMRLDGTVTEDFRELANSKAVYIARHPAQ
jgi:SAM-dependent methyltransferase